MTIYLLKTEDVDGCFGGDGYTESIRKAFTTKEKAIKCLLETVEEWNKENMADGTPLYSESHENFYVKILYTHTYESGRTEEDYSSIFIEELEVEE